MNEKYVQLLPILFAFVILAFSFAPLFHYLNLPHQGTEFPLIHNNIEDYHLYLQFMRQALDGRWMFISRYTTENFPARFVYFPYLLLGKIAAYTRFDLTIVYNASRLLFGIAFIAFIYVFVQSFMRSIRKRESDW